MRLLIFIIAIGFSLPACTQHLLKTNPLSLGIIQEATLHYEYSWNKQLSISLNVHYLFDKDTTKRDFTPQATLKYNGIMIMPEFRYYLKPTAPEGLYIAPAIHFYAGIVEGSTKISPNQFVDFNADYQGLGITGKLGYQLIVAKHIAIDGFVGLSYNDSEFKGNVLSIDNVGDPVLLKFKKQSPRFNELVPRFGVLVGYKF